MAYTRQDICRIGKVASFHHMNRCLDCFIDGSLPACVHQSNHVTDRVEKKDRDAVGEAHEEGYAGSVCQDRVCLEVRDPRRTWQVSTDHFSAVNLPDVEQAFQRSSNRLKGKLTVRLHPAAVVAYCSADV